MKKQYVVQTSENKRYSGQKELWQGEQLLQNYNKDLIGKLTKSSAGVVNVLEFGAGLGTISELWAKQTGVIPDCFEVDPEMVLILKERGFGCYENFESLNKKYDLVFSSNVLEHIENDVEILKELYSITNGGGQLIVYVPANQLLFSKLDKKLGHFRRYGKKELVNKLVSAGYVVTSCHYSDSVGFFAWLFTKLSKSLDDGTNVRKMKVYDKFLFPLSKALDAMGLRYVFGKNLLVYCTKREIRD